MAGPGRGSGDLLGLQRAGHRGVRGSAAAARRLRLRDQYYLHGERGRTGLAAHRAAYARQLWRDWSPTWDFTDADFEATVGSFDNPDFVEVVVHSYRHRYGLVDGDPAYQATEDLIAALPRIELPTVVLDPVDDTISTPSGTHEQPGEPLTPESRPTGRDEPRPGRVLRRSTSPVGMHRE